MHDSLANSQPNFQAMKKTSQSVSETEFAVWILIAMLLVLILVFGYLIDKHISSEFSQSFRVEDTLGLCEGPLVFRAGLDIQMQRDGSEHTAREIDEEVKRLLDRAYHHERTIGLSTAFFH